MSVLLVVAALSMAGQPPRILQGLAPAAIGAVMRVVWIGADGADTRMCAVERRRWECAIHPGDPDAVVVAIGSNGVASRVVNAAAGRSREDAVHRWGRLIVLTAGGVAPEDLHDLEALAWKPERSAIRRQTLRFAPVREPAIQMRAVSATAFWVTGDDPDADAFVAVSGPAVAPTRVAASALSEGPPDTPVFLPAEAPFSIPGRVVGAHLEPVAGCEVEIFEPLPLVPPGRAPVPMIRRAQVRTDADGMFTADRLAPGPYVFTAADRVLGRGTLAIRSLVEPVVVQLTPPVRASGRLLRAHVPVPAARVRFVPDPATLVASTDPSRLMADEVITDGDGAFSLALPLDHVGTIQIVAPDGATVRVPLARGNKETDIALGDLNLQEASHLTVRVLDTASCTLAAVGPIGALGLAVVAGEHAQNIHWFELPEPGQWALTAECDGAPRLVEPSVITIGAAGARITVDVRLLTRGGPP